MLNPFWIPNALHMLLGGVHGDGFRRRGSPRASRCAASRTASSTARRCASRSRWARSAALLQPVSGDQVARQVHAEQPAKLAAIEGQFRSEAARRCASAAFPYPQARRDALRARDPVRAEPPRARTIPHAVIRGLDAFPRDERPTRGRRTSRSRSWSASARCSLRSASGRAGCALARAARASPNRRVVHCGRSSRAAPLGFVAIEAGWIVTEVGPAAVDHLRRDAHRRRGDADAAASAFRFVGVHRASTSVLAVRGRPC